MKSNPTPALPLSGEGVKETVTKIVQPLLEEVKEKTTEIASNTAQLLAPPPDKGEAGRGLNKTKLHNLKPQINNRRQNRKNPTEPEKCFWSWVRGKQLGCKFRRQHGIGQYIVDFYCAEHALIIELDGESHYTTKGINDDKVRTQFLNSKGFKVMRFTNLEIMQNKEGVLITLNNYLKLEGETTVIDKNPTPALPLPGEGVKDKATYTVPPRVEDKATGIVTDKILPLAPPPDKGEVGRGLNKTKAGKQS